MCTGVGTTEDEIECMCCGLQAPHGRPPFLSVAPLHGSGDGGCCGDILKERLVVFDFSNLLAMMRLPCNCSYYKFVLGSS